MQKNLKLKDKKKSIPTSLTDVEFRDLWWNSYCSKLPKGWEELFDRECKKRNVLNIHAKEEN